MFGINSIILSLAQPSAFTEYIMSCFMHLFNTLYFIQFETFYSVEMANIPGKQYIAVRNRNTGDECIPKLNNFSFLLQIRQNLTC